MSKSKFIQSDFGRDSSVMNEQVGIFGIFLKTQYLSCTWESQHLPKPPDYPTHTSSSRLPSLVPAHSSSYRQPLTHDETVVASVLTVEETVAGLEEEQACVGVVVVGCDAEHSQPLPLPQQLLLAGVRPLVGRGLKGKKQCV